MISGDNIVQLGLLAQAEAEASGQLPSPTDLQLAQAARHARHEAALRAAAQRGLSFSGTSVLEAMTRGEVPRTRRYYGPVVT